MNKPVLPQPDPPLDGGGRQASNQAQAANQPWFEYRHVVTFGDTNATGNVYFTKYFSWQGECRERLLAQFYPEFASDLRQGFGMITEYAHQDYFHEAVLFDELRIRMTVVGLSRSRIEFVFEFIRASDDALLCRGRQAVVWTNRQHHPSLMPDKLYDATVSYFKIAGS